VSESQNYAGEDRNDFSVWGFIKGFGKLLIGFLLLIQGIIGLILLLLLLAVIGNVSGIFAGDNDRRAVAIAPGSAFVFDPVGVLVEEAPAADPFETLIEDAYGIQEPSPIALQDAVRTMRAAAADERIEAMVLDLDSLAIAGVSKAYVLIDEIERFKKSGKKVYAISDFLGQTQYLVSAHADEIHVSDFGGVSIYGYGIYRNYYKDLIDKLKITSHIFRVGTFKAAVEPQIRNDMSPEAREANRELIADFWKSYLDTIAETRSVSADRLTTYAGQYDAVMAQYNGDAAAAAEGFKLVDRVMSPSERRKFLVSTFGKGQKKAPFKGVGFQAYLRSLPAQAKPTGDRVAVITVSGVITPGPSQVGQNAGSKTVVDYLLKARDDKSVKAVVLRVDSPGGSAFAGEIMYDAIKDVKQAGKPVVVSMGSTAASAGYLIAAPANEIWAEPTTITGSIGVFAAFNTFENTAAEVGFYTDGVGTTAQSPILAAGLGPLPEVTKRALQSGVEHTYRDFLQTVAEGRGLETDYVDSIGQGRIWTGARAKELKLVDKLGGLEEAIQAAASWANLTEYSVERYEDRRTPFEKLFGGPTARLMAMTGMHKSIADWRASPFGKILREFEDEARLLTSFEDPQNLFMRCLECEAATAPAR